MEKLLEESENAPFWKKLVIYTRLSGPGWVQSAITLGGGSLAGSLFLGVIGGFEMLWVQPLAIIMGIILLASITYVTLSAKKSPFQILKDDINPVIAWGWIIAVQLANMLWVMPQYSLAHAAITENIFSGVIPDTTFTKYFIAFLIFFLMLFINIKISEKGYKVYENTLKVLVGFIVLCFFGVVIALSGTLDWGAVFSGFIPDFSLLSEPSSVYKEVIASLGSVEAQNYWTELVVSAQRDRMVGAAATAVGINMTFLVSWALLSRGWTRKHRTFGIFDLVGGLFIPFIIATSCVMIAAISQFHGKPYEGLFKDTQYEVVNNESKAYNKWNGYITKRQDKIAAPLELNEKKLAAMIIPRGNAELSSSLEKLFGGNKLTQVVFGLGVLAMALSTISVLMLISGFVACEVSGQKDRRGSAFKIGTLLTATGLTWPFLWSGTSKAYFAVVVSTFGYILFPIAFIAFIILMNSKKALGDSIPQGKSRWTWNILMGGSALITGLAAGWTAWNKSLPLEDGAKLSYGKWFVILFIVAIIVGQIIHNKKNSKKE